MSIACAPGLTDEDLGDRVRGALSAEQAEWVEEVAVAARTRGRELPPSALERIGIADDQENLLVRVVLRHPTRSLAKAEANALRDHIYAALHEGSEWDRSYPLRTGEDRRSTPQTEAPGPV
jgi:phenylalanyl-tRNA synthetase alpha chain